MLIKFKEPDPRAGLIARMDSSRGQQLIDAGAADQETEGAAQAVTAEKVDGSPATADQGAASPADAQAVEAEKPKAPRGKK